MFTLDSVLFTLKISPWDNNNVVKRLIFRLAITREMLLLTQTHIYVFK
jgi:hypothetical protein